MSAAAYEFFGRRHAKILDAVPHPQIAAFLAAYLHPSAPHDACFDAAEILGATKRLHARKDAAYRGAWKKRGELTSILANVARKVDRLGQYGATGAELADEPTFDTAVDLFVYLVKYRLYLLERIATHSSTATRSLAPELNSDDARHFDALADSYASSQRSARLAAAVVADVLPGFDALHALASDQNTSAEDRLAKASDLAGLAFELVMALANERPAFVRGLAMFNQDAEPR